MGVFGENPRESTGRDEREDGVVDDRDINRRNTDDGDR